MNGLWWVLVLGWRCPMSANTTRQQAHHRHTEHERLRMQLSPRGRGSGTEPRARRRCQPVRWTYRKEVVHSITNMAVDHDDQSPATLTPRALVDREQHPLGPRRNIQRRCRRGPDQANAPTVLAAIRNIGDARRAVRLDPTAAIRLFTRAEIGTNLRRDGTSIDSIDHAQFGSQSPQDICQHLRNT